VEKKRKKLAIYLLFSFLIHVGALTGIDVYLMPAPIISEAPVLIPVETVILETESEEKEPTLPSLIPQAATPTTEAQLAKASVTMGTPSSRILEDLPGPVPKEGSFKPSMTREHMPSSGVLSMGQEGKEAQSKRVVSRSTSFPVTLPPLTSYPPAQSPILDTQEKRVLTKAQTGAGVLQPTMKPERIRAPLGRNRPHPDYVSELPPIPTVTSPRLPEVEEMVLAEDATTPSSRPGATRVRRPVTTSKSREHLPEIHSDVGLESVSRQQVALAPLMTERRRKSPILRPGESYSMLLLVDTSGSVKGPPLEGIKRSAVAFVGLLGVKDRCAIVTFNDKAALVVPFVSNKDRLRRDITGLICHGKNTVLFDALNYAFGLLEREEDRRRFVVLFSDGKDEGSHVTLHEAVSRAQDSGIVVFCLGYSRVERRYLRTLENIAQETGGVFAEAPQFREIVALFRTARDMTQPERSSDVQTAEDGSS
jgi:Mg-chelatase subunit ChlD